MNYSDNEADRGLIAIIIIIAFVIFVFGLILSSMMDFKADGAYSHASEISVTEQSAVLSS